MFHVIILYLWLSFKSSQTTFFTNENWLLLNPSVLGYGNTLNQIENTSVLTCGLECNLQTNCTEANYFLTNQTCTLLNVEDVVDDWKTNDNVTYICMDCEPGPKGKPRTETNLVYKSDYAINEVQSICVYCANDKQSDNYMYEIRMLIAAAIGLWTFIDQAINLRNPTANITTFNTPFVPAVPGGSTNVMSFLGHKGSYVLLENTGDLAVSSFTWSAIIFPESIEGGPLLVWWSDSLQCEQRGLSIKINVNQRLKFHVCGELSPTGLAGGILSTNQWHEVAVSYDGDTGYAQMYVDGNLDSKNMGLLAQGQTSGPVVMGSRYYFGGSNNPNIKYFQGKMACMRLWNIARDLSTMRMNTPLCKIN